MPAFGKKDYINGTSSYDTNGNLGDDGTGRRGHQPGLRRQRPGGRIQQRRHEYGDLNLRPLRRTQCHHRRALPLHRSAVVGTAQPVLLQSENVLARHRQVLVDRSDWLPGRLESVCLFTGFHRFQQARQIGFGFVNVDGLHGCLRAS